MIENIEADFKRTFRAILCPKCQYRFVLYYVLEEVDGQKVLWPQEPNKYSSLYCPNCGTDLGQILKSKKGDNE